MSNKKFSDFTLKNDLSEVNFLVGYDGLDNVRIDTSNIGIQGPQGIQGPEGPAGSDGVNGSDGAQGSQGPAGADGNDGADGAQGPQGETGPQGPQGDAGADGVDGQDGADGTNGVDGAAGADGVDGQDGAEGPQGPQGLQGPQGDAGADGSDGSQGPQGIQGETGPEGPQGPQGDAGTNGTDGSNGTNGADGDSAYDIWIAAGNTGTEADFLASLVASGGSGGSSDVTTIYRGSMYANQSSTTSYIYIPFSGSSEGTAATHDHAVVAAHDGYVSQVQLKNVATQEPTGTFTELDVAKDTGTGSNPTITSLYSTGNVSYTPARRMELSDTLTSTDATFSAGDILYFRYKSDGFWQRAVFNATLVYQP